MEWPEVAGEEFVAKQDQSARHAAGIIGGESADELFMRTWLARQAAEAEAAQVEATP